MYIVKNLGTLSVPSAKYMYFNSVSVNPIRWGRVVFPDASKFLSVSIGCRFKRFRLPPQPCITRGIHEIPGAAAN